MFPPLGDVILTYSYSKLVEKALLDAAEAGKKIKVIVADERMESLGRKLTSSLVSAGLHTTYILITAVSQILPSVTKVLLGCDGVMANGCVLATVGTSQVGLQSPVSSLHHLQPLAVLHTFLSSGGSLG